MSMSNNVSAGKHSWLGLDLEDGFVRVLAQRYESEPLDIDPEDPPRVVEPPPSAGEIRKLVETTFWASLTKEEGRFHQFSLGFWSEDEAHECLIVFTPRLPFSHESLAKIAPAFPSDCHIGVWRDNPGSELYIWGATYPSSYSFWSGMSIKAAAAGEIIISLPLGSTNAAVTSRGARLLDSDKASMIRLPGSADRWPEGRRQLIAGFPPPEESYLREVGKAMRQHGRGGTLLAVPRNGTAWRNHVDFQRKCRESREVASALDRWHEKLSEWDAEIEKAQTEDPDELGPIYLSDPAEADAGRAGLRLVGQLTAIDGATVVTDQMVVLGFGAKITSESGPGSNNAVFVSEPFEDSQEITKQISEVGGMRHQSAARFVLNNKDCVALVVSQDGAVSFFAWDTARGILIDITHAEFIL